VRIVVDAMGGDRAPGEIVRGSVAAARRLGVEVVLAGQPAAIEPLLAAAGERPRGVTVLAADEVIDMADHAAGVVREKRRSSIVLGLRELREGRADAFVSAGNTGAVMAAAIFVLGRVRGVKRPALGTVFPAAGGRRVLLLDVGANAEARAEFLIQSARMGHAYAAGALGIAQPRVGLLSIGEEASKGNQLIQEVYAALAADPSISFAGNAEGNTIPSGRFDVIVTDGFTGNVAIKVAEGAAELILSELRGALTSRLHYKVAAAVLRPALRAVRSRIDYAEYGGAPLLGVSGVVIVAHGRSDARALFNAVRVARDAVHGRVVQQIAGAMSGAAEEQESSSPRRHGGTEKE
jgi:glycerol-3-phosphate acyltransferase PlsX